MFTGLRGTGNLDGTPGNWNGMEGKFDEIRSTDDPTTGKGFQFYNYGTKQAMEQKTDLTVAGALQDCNECHVGGGAMEYLPAGGKQFTSALLALNSRTSLRDIATAAPGTVNGGAPITSAEFTTFNYFLDSYDIDGDNDKSEILYNDYAKTGVGEVDCLMCHLEGYSWDARKNAIRKAKHDTARAVGAGIATNNALVAADTDVPNDLLPVGYGTTVGAYNGNTANVGGMRKLTSAFADKIKKTPPSANCASCHFGDGFTIAEGGFSAVDVKKRGDHWTDNTNWDVHSAAVECMDCHHNETTALTAGSTGAMKMNTGVVDSNADGLDDNTAFKIDMTGPDANKLGMCDPGHKSGNFVGVWNAKDSNADATTCESCHNDVGAGGVATLKAKFPGAKNPVAAHAAKGLTAVNVQNPYPTTGVYDGTANASHIDIISCSACHIRKLEHYAGGAYLDSTGADLEGHLVDHENEYTLRDMYDSSIPIWYKGKIRKSSVVTTLLWVDNDAQKIDANQDGLEGALDVIMPSQTVKLNKANGRGGSLTHETHGQVTPDLLGQRQMDIYQGLAGLIGEVDAIWPQLNFMHAAFVMDHGTSRANVAWGAKGCKDCHSPYTVENGVRTAGGFYNGPYPMKAKEGSFQFNSGFVNSYGYPAAAGQFGAGPNCVLPQDQGNMGCYGNQPSYMQVAPFYMVNNMTENTNFHPYLYERGSAAKDAAKMLRSLPVDTTSTYAAYGPTEARDVDRSEMLYETNFKKLKANPWSANGGTLTGAPIYVPNAPQGDSNKGYMLTVLVKDNGAPDSTAVRRTLVKPMHNDCVNPMAPACVAENPWVPETVQELIGQFSMMWDGNPAPAATHTTPYGFSLADAGGGALSLVADAGKQIRVLETMSRFAFGFAGYYVTPMGVQYDPAADHVYEADPHVGTKGGAYATRAAWVNYLNGIGAPGTAVITAPAVQPQGLNPAVAGTPVTFTADTTGHVASSTLYKWDMGNGMVYETEKDAGGQPLTTYKHNNGTPSNSADDVLGIAGSLASVSYAYPVTGQFTAQLFVMNSNGGGQTSDSAIVAVGSPVANPTSWTALWDANGTPAVLTDDQMELAGLPANWTKIYVVWDDGTKTNVTTGAGSATADIAHAYRLIAQRQSGGTHVFNPVIRLYNGATLLGSKKVTVTTTP